MEPEDSFPHSQPAPALSQQNEN